MNCGFCGQELMLDTEACPRCGKSTKLPPEKKFEVVYETEQSGERKCGSCGQAVPEGFLFCGACGGKVVEPQPVRLPYCVICGELLTAGSRFCTECGTEYRTSENGYIELPQEDLCPDCGAELVKGFDFCGNCGKPIHEHDRGKVERVIPCCPGCHTPVRSDSGIAFCINCGNFIKNTAATHGYVKPQVAEDGTLTCPCCGESRQRANRLCCWGCGVVFVKDRR